MTFFYNFIVAPRLTPCQTTYCRWMFLGVEISPKNLNKESYSMFSIKKSQCRGVTSLLAPFPCMNGDVWLISLHLGGGGEWTSGGRSDYWLARSSDRAEERRIKEKKSGFFFHACLRRQMKKRSQFVFLSLSFLSLFFGLQRKKNQWLIMIVLSASIFFSQRSTAAHSARHWHWILLLPVSIRAVSIKN